MSIGGVHWDDVPERSYVLNNYLEGEIHFPENVLAVMRGDVDYNLTCHCGHAHVARYLLYGCLITPTDFRCWSCGEELQEVPCLQPREGEDDED